MSYGIRRLLGRLLHRRGDPGGTAQLIVRLLGCRCPFDQLSDVRHALTVLSQLDEPDIPWLAKQAHIEELTLRGLVIQCEYCLRTLEMLQHRGLKVSADSLTHIREDCGRSVDTYFSVPQSERSPDPPPEFVYYAGATFLLTKVKGW
jgi:hypothetical protein